MQNSKKSIAIVVFCLRLLCTDANSQAGNVKAASASESDSAGLSFSENYKRLLGDSSGVLEILNDSSEITDDGKDIALKFDDFVPKKELALSLGDEKSSLGSNFMNVFKVPKTKTKKTLSSRLSSLKNEPVVNDFNSELLFTVNDGNMTDYDTYFHAFTHLYDHSRWNVNSFSLDITKTCRKDMQTYLNDLNLSRDWAVKVNDASGKYRGMFFFDNSFWLGSMQFCTEIDREYGGDIPPLQFFVVNLVIKLEPVNQRVSTNVQCHYRMKFTFFLVVLILIETSFMSLTAVT
jgi:hypothetical protein